MSQDVDGKPPLGPIATRILFEDDRVRVWDQVIEPGAETGPHEHVLPYALVSVDAATLEVLPVSGYPMMHGEEPITIPLEAETATVLAEGAVENARNIGKTTYRAILVEFKSR